MQWVNKDFGTKTEETREEEAYPGALGSKHIPWESFRPLLESTTFKKERKSPADRKRIDVIVMFKMLMLQQLFNLSDEELRNL